MIEKKQNIKLQKKLHSYVRAGIQILFFLWLPSAFTTAFSGVKTIFTQIGRGEAIELSAFVSVLIVLSIYTFVFGRFFCGYACAFGSLGDAMHALYRFVCKKCKKRPVQIPSEWKARFSFVKYVVLLAIVLLCFGGVYGGTGKYSPWEVFSMLTAGNFKLNGHVIGICLLVLILVGMAVCERFFCRFLCPMGAVFSMLPVIPLFAARRNREECIKGCSGCQRNCPSDIALPDTDSWEVKGDCFMCQKCMDVCPKGNVKSGRLPWKGNAIWFTLLRAALLAALLIWIGV